MHAMLERAFGLARHGTTVRREVTAGLTTFATLSYILFVQPAVLSSPACGMDPGGVLFATCVASAVACLWMALRANYPFALAPAMGHNFFFAFTVCAGMGFRWQEALAANFVAGALFLAVARLGVREAVMNALPGGLKHAITAGIGMMIALIGLQWGGLVVDHPALLVTLGDLSAPVARVTLIGLAVTAVLLARGVAAALLLGIAAAVLANAAVGPEPLALHGIVAAPPDPSATAFRLDFAALFARPAGDWLAVIAVFLLLDLFDTVGTLTGVADRAGLLVDGRLPRARAALTADAAGTTLGALLGTSTVTTYVESAAGVTAGGRTGLVAAVAGACLLAGLFFAPLIEVIGAGVEVATATGTTRCYPVLAPVLIVIGALMLGAARRVAWDDPSQAIPAFLTIAIMQLGVSITDGIAFGCIAWSVLGLAARRPTGGGVHVLAGVFVLRYALL